jgi:hypothetical protein
MCIIFNQYRTKLEAGSEEEPETQLELGKNSQSRQQKLRQGYIEKSVIPGLNLRPIVFGPKSQFSSHSQHLVSHDQYMFIQFMTIH